MRVLAYKETNYYPGVPVWFFKVVDGGSTTVFEYYPDYDTSLAKFKFHMECDGKDITNVPIEKGTYVTTWVPEDVMCVCGEAMSLHYDSRDEPRPFNAVVSHPGTPVS